jgi:hypothetical protein
MKWILGPGFDIDKHPFQFCEFDFNRGVVGGSLEGAQVGGPKEPWRVGHDTNNK